MSTPSIRLLQLYPDAMNIYGDWGNTLTLKKRLEWRGYSVELLAYNPGDNWPEQVDIIVGGGGQDSGQSKIQDDLLSIGPKLKALADDDVPMLVICGLYQLFGQFFETREGEVIKGIGLLDIETHGGDERMIGNIVTNSNQFGEIVGYENHSGLTTLGDNVEPFAEVIRGAGNNGQDATEGARYKNVIGTYLHGSLLPKNPAVADFLIAKALERRLGTTTIEPFDDSLADKARSVAKSRPR